MVSIIIPIPALWKLSFAGFTADRAEDGGVYSGVPLTVTGSTVRGFLNAGIG